MPSKNISAAAFADTKPHYELLDGMRGVAALMVIWYHVFEGFATSPIDQHFNHGYMAVDFFFILSGFVIGYAYDDRWKKMTTKNFFKRRLIRLHPMVVLGTIIGLITYCIQGCVHWDGTPVPFPWTLLAVVMTLFLIPALPGTGPEVRGNGEMYPLNGPFWSLFFEYIGNILYALFVRKLSTKALTAVVVVTGLGLAASAIGNLSEYGHIGMGWSLSGWNLVGGFARMAFSYSAGLLISRRFKPMKIKGAFWLCSLILFIVLAIPHAGGNRLWINGLYDTLCITLVFPFVVFMAASGKTTDAFSSGLCKFLGDISYPLYMVHYPIMYLFYAWLWTPDPHMTFAQTWPVAVGIFFGNILLAYLALKLYDEPIRRRLSKRFL